MHKVLRCDCGFRVVAESEAALVAGAEAHSREAHGPEVAAEVVAGLLGSNDAPQ